MAAEAAPPRSGPSAMTMYSLLAAQPLTNWVTRGAIAPLMQFIVAEMGFSAAQKALLLGAFYPGYLVTQCAPRHRPPHGSRRADPPRRAGFRPASSSKNTAGRWR